MQSEGPEGGPRKEVPPATIDASRPGNPDPPAQIPQSREFPAALKASSTIASILIIVEGPHLLA